ncbi:hypothetical protein JCM1393_02930 [Clostridium carnis]
MKLSKKMAIILLTSTLTILLIIIILINAITKIIYLETGIYTTNIRTSIIIASMIIGIINIGIYLYINNRIINRLSIVDKSIKNFVETSEEDNKINLNNSDEISNICEKIKVLINKIKSTESHLKQEERNYTNILNAMSNSFIHLKAIENNSGNFIDGVIVDVNEAAIDLFEVDKSNIINKKLSEVYKNYQEFECEIKDILKRIKISKAECIAKEVNITKDKWGIISIYFLQDGYFSIIINDVTDIKRYSDDMEHLARYDTLTNLINRHNLFEYLIELISIGKEFSVFFIDLDNFKNINDTLGHNTGDEILRITADKLTDLESDNILVGRLGGDEFIIVRIGENDDEDIKLLANKTLKSLNGIFKFNNISFELKASLGISYYPQHTDDIFTLLQYADISMYEVKNSGGNGFRIFAKEMLESVILEGNLISAIENNEFEVYYQPIYDVNNKKIVGAEALIRWIKDGEIIPPDKFIKIAKRNGEIIKIDEFVLREACKYCKKWIEKGEEDFKISVNISYIFLKQPNFIDRVMTIINEVGVEPKAIKLEITEDEIIDDTKYTIEILNKIRKFGIKISLDDFGVGYSSFNHIKILPLDTIKIDRSLLMSLEKDKKTVAIIETLIKLCHTLNLDVICEGVEIKSQLNLLKEINCDKVQGYYISRPLRVKHFDEFVINFNKIEEKIIKIGITYA